MKPAPKFALNELDYKKIATDSLYFFIVPATFYITAVLGLIQLPNHVISVTDFIPSNNTIVAIVAWILNQVLNLLRKYVI